LTRREFNFALALAPLVGPREPKLEELRELWRNPPRTFRPHARWRPEGGVQLASLRASGIGGVEIGCPPSLSGDWKAPLLRAVEQAAALDMEVSLAFGPSAGLAGAWVAPQDRAKMLAPVWEDVAGSREFDQLMPPFAFPTQLSFPADHGRILAAVAGRLTGPDTLDGATLTDLTPFVAAERVTWQVPAGRWRIAAFRLCYTGQQYGVEGAWAADHLDIDATRPAVNFLCRELREALGEHLGKTVDSFFCDGFVAAPLPGTLLWSKRVLDAFAARKMYELRPFLPALWWDIGPETARIRYDVNEQLHQMTLDAVFRVLRDEFADVGVDARVRLDGRMPAEIVQAAGMIPRPEIAGAADAGTVADPRKAAVSGCRFYGGKHVSADASAAHALLRDGVTQFDNLGDPGQAAGLARCCAVLRQGRSVGDVLLYSPQNQVWRERVLAGVERRALPYGAVPGLLVANGYDYDIVNDDLLLNKTEMTEDQLDIAGNRYAVLVLPNITWLAPTVAARLAEFAAQGLVLLEVKDLSQPPASFLAGLRNRVAPDFSLSEPAGGVCHQHRRIGEADVYFVANLSPRRVSATASFRVAGKRAEVWDAQSARMTPLAGLRERAGRTEAPLALEPGESRIFVFDASLPPARKLR
jgi:hypothetical protein